MFYGLNDCMVVTHHPTQVPNYPYLFSSVKREYRKFQFYDHISYRFISNLYLKRLTESLPVFAHIQKTNINLKKLPQYIEFTKHYWTIHKAFETIDVDIDNEKKELDEYSGLPKKHFSIGG